MHEKLQSEEAFKDVLPTINMRQENRTVLLFPALGRGHTEVFLLQDILAKPLVSKQPKPFVQLTTLWGGGFQESSEVDARLEGGWSRDLVAFGCVSWVEAVEELPIERSWKIMKDQQDAQIEFEAFQYQSPSFSISGLWNLLHILVTYSPVVITLALQGRLQQRQRKVR